LTLDTNIKVISVTTGIIETGNLYSSSKSYQGYTSNSINVDIKSKIRVLLKSIAHNFIADLESITKDESSRPNEIMIDFNSTPKGASIEVDGIYVGSTPSTIPVSEGIHRVVISMGGYESWDKKVKFFEGFVVDAHLGEKKDDEDEVTNE